MSGINAGKVIVGGLIAGLVFNVLDILAGIFLFADEFRMNAERLGLDPAAMESTGVMASWIVIDFILGILVIWTYAGMRPRFGPGPRTAAYAGLTLFVAVSAVLYGFVQMDMLPAALYWKQSAFAAVNVLIGSMAGAAVYKES